MSKYFWEHLAPFWFNFATANFNVFILYKYQKCPVVIRKSQYFNFSKFQELTIENHRKTSISSIHTQAKKVTRNTRFECLKWVDLCLQLINLILQTCELCRGRRSSWLRLGNRCNAHRNERYGQYIDWEILIHFHSPMMHLSYLRRL